MCMPLMSLPIFDVKSGTSRGEVVKSCLSWPAIAFNINALSLTFRVIGPIWSRLDEKAINPYRDTRPYVGLKPTTPLNAAGCRIEPPVSEPKAAINSPEATAAAGPPEEPPGTFVWSHAFFVFLKAEVSVELPIANSSRFNFPATTIPAFSSRSTAVAV